MVGSAREVAVEKARGVGVGSAMEEVVLAMGEAEAVAGDLAERVVEVRDLAEKN